MLLLPLILMQLCIVLIVSTFNDRASAADARDAFKAKYSNRKDFQSSWLLYRLK